MARERHLIPLAVFLLPILASSAFAGCRDIYPDTQVTAKLAKAEYQDCTLAVMAADYAEVLKQQARLIKGLRPAYARKLSEEYESEAQQLRLNECNNELQRLTTAAAALATLGPVIGSHGATEGERTDGPDRGAELRNLLKEGKDCSQALKRKITLLAKEKLTGDELAAYCKLDFYFRLREELHGKIVGCSHPPN